MIEYLQLQFHSMLKALDIFYVVKGLKPVSRIIVKDDELPDKADFIKSLGLKFSISNFKIDYEKEFDKEFTNKGVRITKESTKKGFFLMYISKKLSLAEISKRFEEKNMHEDFGISLGYPKCCSKFFDNNYNQESKRYNDYILVSLRNSDGFNFPYQNNFAVRNFDIALISHFPCRFNCIESKKIGESNLLEIMKDNEDISKILGEMLKGSVVYTEDEGVFFLRRTNFINNRLFFKTIMASSGNDLSKKIKDAVFIDVIDKNTIRIENKIIEGKYGFLRFI